MIPQTITYREYKAKRANRVTKTPRPLQNGQTTLDAQRSLPERPLETGNPHEGTAEDASMSDDVVEEQAGELQRPESSKVNGNGLVFEHYEPNGTSRRDDSGDVDMS